MSAQNQCFCFFLFCKILDTSDSKHSKIHLHIFSVFSSMELAFVAFCAKMTLCGYWALLERLDS